MAALALATALVAPADATLQTSPAALEQTMRAAFARGAKDGWHFADRLAYFSTVLDAGRAYASLHRSDSDSRALEGYALDLASELHYDPLISRDAAEWYLREAAGAFVGDATRGTEAAALLAKLSADDADPARLAADADADATANLADHPRDAEALVEQVSADVRAFLLTRDPRYRSLALVRASQPDFPLAQLPSGIASPLRAFAADVASAAAASAASDRAAAHALASHWAAVRLVVPRSARVLKPATSQAAPADEYFGQTRLSPLGVRDELMRIDRYLDAGWGDRMTSDALYLVDALQDWQHQYPRDYELPRLLLRTYQMLSRMTSPSAQQAAAAVRRELTVDYNDTPEARSLLASSQLGGKT